MVNHCLVSDLEVDADCGEDTVAALHLLYRLVVRRLPFLLCLAAMILLGAVKLPEDGSIIEDCTRLASHAVLIQLSARECNATQRLL